MQRFMWIVGLAVCCLPVPSSAQSAPETAAPAASTEPAPLAPSSVALALASPGFEEGEPVRTFHRNTRQFGDALVVGFGTHSLGSKERHDLALASLRVGRMLGRSDDRDRWQRGHLELIGEVWGGEQRNGRRRTLVGLTPFLRYNFAARGRWVPFGDFGVGVAYTNIHGHDLSNGWQFNLQGGVGTHYFLREALALTLQYRWFHLSNAGLNVPNSGLNTHIAYVGLSRFH